MRVRELTFGLAGATFCLGLLLTSTVAAQVGSAPQEYLGRPGSTALATSDMWHYDVAFTAGRFDTHECKAHTCPGPWKHSQAPSFAEAAATLPELSSMPAPEFSATGSNPGGGMVPGSPTAVAPATVPESSTSLLLLGLASVVSLGSRRLLERQSVRA